MLSRRIIRVLPIIVLILALSHLSTYFLPTNRGGEDEINIPRLFVKAIELQNSSNTILRRIKTGLTPNKDLIHSICTEGPSISEDITSFYQTLGEGDLAKKLKRAALTYEKAIRASIISANSSSTIATAVKGLRETLSLADRCRVDEALKTWREIKPVVLEAIDKLEDTLKVLIRGDPKSLLSNEHTQVYEDNMKLITELLSSLKEASKTMELIEEYSSEFKKVCEGGEACSLLKQRARGLKCTGCLGYLIASIKSRILMTSQGGRGTGGGAGYAPPSTDD